MLHEQKCQIQTKSVLKNDFQWVVLQNQQFNIFLVIQPSKIAVQAELKLATHYMSFE